jgi:hypothetical protein
MFNIPSKIPSIFSASRDCPQTIAGTHGKFVVLLQWSRYGSEQVRTVVNGSVAGAPGFEPGNGGIKIRCLTTWLRPIAPSDCRSAPFAARDSLPLREISDLASLHPPLKLKLPPDCHRTMRCLCLLRSIPRQHRVNSLRCAVVGIPVEVTIYA